jgi:hypothetical protein
VGLIFTWDKKKAAFNLRKHDIAFEEAATAFGDTLSLTTFNPDYQRTSGDTRRKEYL